MSLVAIRAEDLGKRYRVGERERYLTLRDTLADMARAPLRILRRNGNAHGPRYIWALRNASFDVSEGEVVGIIGRNGAGKTTLLKILARVTRPTEGRAEVHGRLGSLLEVGTGFHGELTGRENIYLSGAILGMKRKEIERRFDEIVAFSEVGDFLDTPLKHYSSGMHMRLAFAVAAHLEPEILLVDEVLAVGDLAFQKKCLGKMSEVARGGRTILFVSHQMNQIRRLCERVMWIDAGHIRQSGPAGEVIGAYEATMLGVGSDAREGDKHHFFVRWEVAGQGNVLKEGLAPVQLNFTVRIHEPVVRGHFGLQIRNDANQLMGGWGFDNLALEPGLRELSVQLPTLPLRPGTYTLECTLYDDGGMFTGGKLLEEWNAVPYLVVDTLPLAHQLDAWSGVLNLPAELSVGPRRSEPREP